MTNKPAHKLRDGLITATIWGNWSEAKKATFYTINIGRSYKDKAEKWQEDSSFLGDEALRAARLLQRAYDWTVDARAADRATPQADDGVSYDENGEIPY